MKRSTAVLSLLLGAFAVYSAIFALRVMWFYAGGALWVDAVRLITLSLCAGLGLGLLTPLRFLPALRAAAERFGTGPMKFAMALAVFLVLLTAILSQAVPRALIFLALAVWSYTFFLPAPVFQNVGPAQGRELSPVEFGYLGGQLLRQHPRAFAVWSVCVSLIFIGLASVVVSPHVVASAAWGNAALIAGLLSGVAIPIVIFAPMFAALPRDNLLPTLPAIVLPVAVLSILTIPTQSILLSRSLPAILAATVGTETTRAYVVLSVSRDTGRRECRNRLVIAAPKGPKTLCTLGRGELEVLESGDTISIHGPATGLGQTIRDIEI